MQTEEMADYSRIERQQVMSMEHLNRLFQDQTRNEKSTLQEMKETEELDSEEKTQGIRRLDLAGLIKDIEDVGVDYIKEDKVEDEKVVDDEDSYV